MKLKLYTGEEVRDLRRKRCMNQQAGTGVADHRVRHTEHVRDGGRVVEWLRGESGA